MLQETPLKDPEWACYEGHVGKRYGWRNGLKCPTTHISSDSTETHCFSM